MALVSAKVKQIFVRKTDDKVTIKPNPKAEVGDNLVFSRFLYYLYTPFGAFQIAHQNLCGQGLRKTCYATSAIYQELCSSELYSVVFEDCKEKRPLQWEVDLCDCLGSHYAGILISVRAAVSHMFFLHGYKYASRRTTKTTILKLTNIETRSYNR